MRNITPKIIERWCVEIALEYNCRPSDVSRIWNSIWVGAKRAMGQRMVPDIVIPFIGTFKPNSRLLRRRLFRYIYLYREGRIDGERFARLFVPLWQVYKIAQARYVKHCKSYNKGRFKKLENDTVREDRQID